MRGDTAGAKRHILRQKLRSKFLNRDRVVRQLAVVDDEIAVMVRSLAALEGVSFLRVEAARTMVFEDEGKETAGVRL